MELNLFITKWFNLIFVGMVLVLFSSVAAAQQPTGNFKEYYDSGILKLKGKYRNQQKQGIWSYYNSNGKLEKKIYYRADNPNRTMIYHNGKLQKTIYKSGKIVYAPNCGCQ